MRDGTARRCGEDWTADALAAELLTNADIMAQSGGGVTFSGGEPFCQAEMFTELAEKVREKGLSVTVFSGYTYEQLLAMAEKDVHVKRLLELTDLLIDGPFVKAQRDLTLQFRGSRNQRLIDMKKTREAGKVVLWGDDSGSGQTR